MRSDVMWPGGQATQLVGLPFASFLGTCPGEQVRHELMLAPLVLIEYVPGGQRVGALAPAGQDTPVGHALAPPGQYVPAGQGVQVAAPAAAYVPPAHCEQITPPVAPYVDVPGGHCEQVVAPAAAIVPARQGVGGAWSPAQE
jgi:hypothetical protein